jgi:ribosomal peptide maturation radical SAM protein 1
MPFAAPYRPSIALGLLKSSLNSVGIESRIYHPNLWYAEAVSLEALMRAEGYRVECLVGEWIFSSAVFPDFHPDEEAYYALLPDSQPEERSAVSRLRELSPEFVDLTARRILRDKPGIVACTSMFQQHCASLALLRRTKELAPEVITVMGGANCEASMGEVTHSAFSWVDYLVNGEAEVVFPLLCADLLEGRRTTLAGVLTPWDRGEDVKPERLTVDDLNQSPVPDYDDYFEALEESTVSDCLSPGLPVETSRGCWWGQKHHCTFCGLNGSGMGYRSKSGPRVLDEFDALAKRYKVRAFALVDNIIDMAHLKTVLPVLADRPERYSLFYETKANLRRDQVRLLSEAGVNWIQPGIESMHDEVLKLMDKGTTALINVQLLKWCCEFGIKVTWNLLMGFPGEKPEWYEEMTEWLPLIAHLQPPTSMGMVRYDRFSPYHTAPDRYGIELSPCPTYAFVYPLNSEELSDLAYFFEDQPGSIRRVEREREEGSLRGTREAVHDWKRRSRQPLPPILSVEDDGSALHFLDTRPCAPSFRQTLQGSLRELYLACDESHAEKSPEKLALLDELVRRRLVLKLNERYLTLAVRGDLPSRNHRFPGGDLLEVAVGAEPSVERMRACLN